MRLHIQTNHRQKYPRRRAARSSARFGRLFPHTLLIQARHLFYGLSLLGKYSGTGWKKPLLIFGLCDETFSITCSADVPPEVDRGWFYLWVTVLDWCYWVAGAAVLLHIWRRQMLLSIAGGTIVYMLLVQMM